MVLELLYPLRRFIVKLIKLFLLGEKKSGGAKGVIFLSGMDIQNIRPREPHLHGVVTNLHTGHSTLDFYGIPLGYPINLLSLE